MLTDSEVDRRFSTLVADLKVAVQAVEWPPASERWDARSGSDVLQPRRRSIAALRLIAAGMVVTTVALGVVGLWSLSASLILGLMWFGVAVPALTLAAVTLVERV